MQKLSALKSQTPASTATPLQCKRSRCVFTLWYIVCVKGWSNKTLKYHFVHPIFDYVNITYAPFLWKFCFVRVKLFFKVKKHRGIHVWSLIDVIDPKISGFAVVVDTLVASPETLQVTVLPYQPENHPRGDRWHMAAQTNWHKCTAGMVSNSSSWTGTKHSEMLGDGQRQESSVCETPELTGESLRRGLRMHDESWHRR